MKFTCLKTAFSSLLKKLRKSPPPPLTRTHARTQASVLNSRRGHNEDTSSTSLKYYIQDSTVNNYHFKISLQPQNNYASLYITPFPLGNYIQFNREQYNNELTC